nr:uncharacterized protein LOC127303979 [Lolium perenne]
MPPRRRSASGYRAVRGAAERPLDAEIRSGDERIRLGTFDTAHEAARAYDYRRSGASQRRRRELEQRLLIAERDEALRLEWARQFPEDVAATEAFYAQKEEEKAAAKTKKKEIHLPAPIWQQMIGPNTESICTRVPFRISEPKKLF